MIVTLIVIGVCVIGIYRSHRRIQEIDQEEERQFYRDHFEQMAFIDEVRARVKSINYTEVRRQT